MQRPFFSQSPNLVGSGPVGPPISRGRDGAEVAVSATSGTAAGAGPEVAEGESGLIDTGSGVDTGSGRAAARTECGDNSFFSARFGIQLLCQNPNFGTTGNTWKNNA
jgi:hypothetical protein